MPIKPENRVVLTRNQVELAIIEWFKHDVDIDQHNFHERMERAIGAALAEQPLQQRFTQEQLDALALASGFMRGAGMTETARFLWDMRRGEAPRDTTPPQPSADGGQIFPAELPPPVRRILGMMLWESGPIAGALRAAGRQINNRPEDEQATALHWLLGFALEHGMEWEKPAAAALLKMTQGIKD